MHRRHSALSSVVLAAAASAFLSSAAFAVFNDPIGPRIPVGPLSVSLQPVASGLVAPDYALSIPGDPSSLLVVDQAGPLRLIKNGVLQSNPILDLTPRLNTLVNVSGGKTTNGLKPGYDERGFLGLAFDPHFNDPSAPGYHKIYTFNSEGVTAHSDFTVPDTSPFDHQDVLSSWTFDPSTGAVDTSSRQEILRWDKPQLNHNGGTIAFGPDGFLYMALGDGGAANDVGPGHNPVTGNAQDNSVVLGKMLRLDVNNNSPSSLPGVNGNYKVPADNPFVGQAGKLPEIFANGFRNPYRWSFDGNRQIVADVGQDNVEEVDLVTKGANYGWHLKEGTFKFNPADGTVSSDLTGLPPGLTDPVLEYDHSDGIAIIGGFVYHGSALPGLDGKYIFADLSTSFGTPDGHLLYGDLTTGEIHELLIGPGSSSSIGLYIKGLGEDASGNIFLLGSTALGPSGTTGVVEELVATVPEPSTLSLLALPALALIRRRRPLPR